MDSRATDLLRQSIVPVSDDLQIDAIAPIVMGSVESNIDRNCELNHHDPATRDYSAK
jgi:hypothetical protein